MTIRNVPETVRDELAARAALQARSLQEYLRAELIALAARPAPEALMRRVRARKTAAPVRLSEEQILAHRDEDRH